MMAIVKLLLFVVSTVVRYYGTRSPNARPAAEQLREQSGTERAVPLLVSLGRAVLLSWTLLECSLLFALSGYCPPALARPLLLHLRPSSDPATLTPTFLVGTVLTLACGLLRLHCYNALGARFTFELSIRPAHALVTHGVYSVVRHPSYTAVIGMAVGSTLCMLDPRGCVMSVLGFGGGDAIATGVRTCIWMMTVVMPLGLHMRMNREDAMLEKQFGKTWRAWAKKVPWRLVPGVY